jgi:negative regulator of flagellin synthesis FlgM
VKVSSDKNLEQSQALAKAKHSKKAGAAGTVSARDMKTEEVIGNHDSAKVQLSERAQDMKKIREAVDKTPDVDEEKVARFRALIAKGEYQPDAGKVADKLVEEHAYNAFFDDEK